VNLKIAPAAITNAEIRSTSDAGLPRGEAVCFQTLAALIVLKIMYAALSTMKRVFTRPGPDDSTSSMAAKACASVRLEISSVINY